MLELERIWKEAAVPVFAGRDWGRSRRISNSRESLGSDSNQSLPDTSLEQYSYPSTLSSLTSIYLADQSHGVFFFKNEWSYTFTAPYVFKALCLFKHTDDFTFTVTVTRGAVRTVSQLQQFLSRGRVLTEHWTAHRSNWELTQRVAGLQDTVDTSQDCFHSLRINQIGKLRLLGLIHPCTWRSTTFVCYFYFFHFFWAAEFVTY
jgi:hypothetical protein